MGYTKLWYCADQAEKDGLEYFWIDTCGLDKSSSAELSEAINSMYRWYQRAEVCYVFLSNLSVAQFLENTLEKCRWFTRGWTLQELIAPVNMQFFDQSWNHRGSKESMVEILSEITTISTSILARQQPLSSVAVAQRMSWAAKRQTTRI